MGDQTLQDIGEQLLAAKKFKDEKAISDRLGKMIDYGIKRQDWYEDQRNKILALGLTLLGLSSFLVSGLLNEKAQELVWFRAFATASLLAIVATSWRIISIYAQGASQQYTHRDLAKIRSWFFAYVVNDKVAEAAIFDSARHTNRQEVITLAWKKFVSGWNEYAEKKSGFVVEDLQQVFILYLFQAMRRTSLRKMINVATFGGRWIAFFLALTIVAAGFRI